MHNITTTDGREFTYVEHVDLARLIYKRFGNDLNAATNAWCRLMQNNTKQSEFTELIDYPEHTHHCEGNCMNNFHSL